MTTRAVYRVSRFLCWSFVLTLTTLLPVPLIQADTGSFPVRNKPGSKVTITSLRVKTTSGPNVTVTPPPGWTATQPVPTDPSIWELNGGSIPPGGSVTISLSNPNGPATAHSVSADYVGSNGKKRWVSVCSDPLSVTVVEGGATGTTYLGYSIPPNQFGYFYELWNRPTFTDQTKRCEVTIGTGVGATNFAVISNSFEPDPVAGFDLGDMEVWSALPDNAPYDFQHYMEPEDATGMAGAPTTWSYDSGTGVATMTFYPANPLQGLGPSEAGGICALTSPYGPELAGPSVNVVAFNLNNTPCPSDFTLRPLGPAAVPTLSEWSMYALVLVLLSLGIWATRRRRARVAAGA